MYAGVHILGAPYQIDKEYDYVIPEQLSGVLDVGSVVIVPFGIGNRHVAGIVSSVKDSSEYKNSKPIIGTAPDNLSIGAELYGICEFLKDRCFCSIGEASKAVMPSGFSVRTSVFYRAGSKARDGALNESAAGILAYVNEKGEVSESELKAAFDGSLQTLKYLCSRGYLSKISRADCKVNTKNDKYVQLKLSSEEVSELLSASSSSFTVKQLSAIAELEKNPFSPIGELRELSGVSDAVIRELQKKNVVDILPIPKNRNPYADIRKEEAISDFSLSECQRRAFDTLYALYKDEAPRAALLHGVTGSGKTNVVQKLTDECVRDGKSAIILVPEIALTSQAVGIFMKRYGDIVAVLHSGLSAGERLDAWKRIDKGEARVILGTRSAIFAPAKNLGLIVIDEEQESSFKSEMTPRYHARDIARYRCGKTGAFMLLCSATPSIESYYKAKEGTYTLVEMKERYSKGGLPTVEMCDMRDNKGEFPLYSTKDGVREILNPNFPKILSDRLLSELKTNLENKQQSILFINRRGYQSFLSCKKCGFVLECPHCSVSMTYHKYGYGSGGRMVCHYCGHTAELPRVCPNCGSEHTTTLGYGTQLLEEHIGMYFPDARIVRMDTDTTSGKFAHDRILESFRNGEADILLGTQMVTKGHDFPNVSLVGVLSADSCLYMPDFRANERTFSVMTQVIGRAGRAELSGRALIQTYTPDHDVLVTSARQDYESFYNSEISFRRAALYPPFCDMIVINFTSAIEREATLSIEAFGRDLISTLNERYSDLKLCTFGPFKAGVYKVAGKYRMRFVLKGRNSKRLRQLISEVYSRFLEGSNGDVSVSIDMDPQNI